MKHCETKLGIAFVMVYWYNIYVIISGALFRQIHEQRKISMKNIEISGVCPIIAAPFTESGEVDFDSLKNLIKKLAGFGAGALTLFGIAGEYYKLSDAEQDKMALVTADECRKAGVPSIMSVTKHSTICAVEQAKKLEASGADCLMLLPPFFLKPAGEELYKHMLAVCRAVDIPVMIQYAPEQTGVAIAPSVFEKLTAEAPNARYYKIECKPAGKYITSMISSGIPAKIFVGNAGFQMIEALDRGAVGLMPGCSMTDVYIKAYDAYKRGDRDEAKRIHTALLEILNHIRQNVEMIIFFEKKILKRRGFIESDYCRAPSFSSDKYFDSMFDEYYSMISRYFVK